MLAFWLLLGLAFSVKTDKRRRAILRGGTLDITWSDCGNGLTHGTVSDLQPTQMIQGQKTDLKGSGTIDEAVQDGNYEIKMNAGFVKLDWTGDLCQPKTFNLPLNMGTVVFGGMSCPLAAGAVTVPMSITLSNSLPPSLAKANIHMTASSKNGDNLLCLDMNTKPAMMDHIPPTPKDG